MEEILNSIELTPKQADLLATPTVWDGRSEHFSTEECAEAEDLFFDLQAKADAADADLKVARDGDLVVVSLAPMFDGEPVSRSFDARWAK